MKKIYFKKGCFLASDNRTYNFDIDENDRFYQSINSYISTGIVESSTNILIDKIIITDPDGDFFQNDVFVLRARMMMENEISNNKIIKSYSIEIERVAFNDTTSIAKNYNNGKWEISLGELKIPYQTDILVKEL